MPRAKVNGLAIAYRQLGEGPALVLLHGFSQDSRVWTPQLRTLSGRFRVIAWDAPGAGRSQDPPQTFTIGDWANSLAGFLDVIGVQTAHILGLSWGGILAQEYYRLYPERVLSLVLADTYAGWAGSLPEPIARERLAACLRDSSLRAAEFAAKYLPGMFSDAARQPVRRRLFKIMSDFHPLGFRLMATSSAQADMRDMLPTIRVPTLVVWGDADKRSPMQVAHQIRDAIPGACLAVITGAGHVSNFEAPDRFNAEVLAFCSQHR